MARPLHRLTARTVASLTATGYYADGGGLYLQISAYGTKSWTLRYQRQGRAREMGLGPTHTVSLAEARREAERCRKLLREGVDPIEQRKAARAQAALASARIMTFRACADAFLDSHEIGWKNAKHRQQWRNTLDTYAGPVLGDLPVAAVDTGLVLRVLEPIWQAKPETATRLRGRIERILAWATTRGYRTGENPARWKGHLDTLLPARAKIRKVEHHAALPYTELPTFMAGLRAQPGLAARALELAILCASRTGEVLGMRWDEINLEQQLWIVPGERMKAGRPHRVPLSDPALAILEAMATIRINDFVFPGARPGKGLSNMALLQLLKRMGRDDLTAQGFRSTFRDWASERTGCPREVCEAALAHAVADKVEAAYRRGDLFEKRRRLMADWGRFCAQAPARGSVVPLRRGTATD